LIIALIILFMSTTIFLSYFAIILIIFRSVLNEDLRKVKLLIKAGVSMRPRSFTGHSILHAVRAICAGFPFIYLFAGVLFIY